MTSPPGDRAETWMERGLACARAGRRDEALAAFAQAVAWEPHSAKAHQNLGVARAQTGLLEEAVQSLREAIRLQPSYAEAYYNLGNVLDQLELRDEALAAYRQAHRFKPDHTDTLNNLGLALVERRPDEAAVLLRHALRLRPDFREALNNLGLALTELGDFRAAEACFHQVLAREPHYAEGHTNLGNLYKEEGRPEAALACYDLALTYQPQSVSTHWNRALVLLQQGDFQRGWAEYEWRRQKPKSGLRPFVQPAWDGRPLEGQTILLHVEQGLGDMLQFIRYAPAVRRRGGRVVVACPASLLSLFRRVPGVDMAVDEQGPLPPCDVQAPLLSLPYLLGTISLEAVSETPYLAVDATQVEHWRTRLAPREGVQVGLAWQGNPQHRKDRQRSVPVAQFECLASVPGVHLHSLQRGFGSEQRLRWRGETPLEDLLGAERDPVSWEDTAAFVQNLDVVITVDTAVAHLAGGLGVPTWLVLPRSADWRWLLDRADSPWYPSLRLFRQATAGDWETVFRAVRAALQRRAEQPKNARHFSRQPGS